VVKNDSQLPSINLEALLRQVKNVMPHYFLTTKSRAIKDLAITHPEN
jgi:hypothetical protein